MSQHRCHVQRHHPAFIFDALFGAARIIMVNVAVEPMFAGLIYLLPWWMDFSVTGYLMLTLSLCLGYCVFRMIIGSTTQLIHSHAPMTVEDGDGNVLSLPMHLRAVCPSLFSFFPTPWLPSSHLQSFYSTLQDGGEIIDYERCDDSMQ